MCCSGIVYHNTVITYRLDRENYSFKERILTITYHQQHY